VNPRLVERTMRDYHFVRLDELQGALDELFEVLKADPAASQVPQVAEMISARAQIEALEHDKTLADEERIRRKRFQEGIFSQKSSDLFARIQADPEDTSIKAVADFFASPVGKKLTQNVDRALAAAVASKGMPPLPELSQAELAEIEARQEVAARVGVAEELLQAVKASIHAMDTKNGRWDSQHKDWNNWRSYDQMSAEEKRDVALAVKECGDKWKAVLSKCEKNSGVVPPEIQDSYKKQKRSFAEMGFGNEFTKGAIAEHYPEAKRAKRDHDGSTITLAGIVVDLSEPIGAAMSVSPSPPHGGPTQPTRAR